MKFSYYESATGKVLATGSAPDTEEVLPRGPGEGVIFKYANPQLHYVDVTSGERRDKHEITATLSGLTLSGLPIPATVTIEGVPYLVEDGTAELSFNLPGTYQVKCEALHHLPKTLEVTV